MNREGALIALGILLGWAVFQALQMVPLAPPLRAGLGLVAGGVMVVLARRSVVVRGGVALLAPFGVALPAVALVALARAAGLAVPEVSAWELVVFLLAYMSFLISAFGLIPLDIYRWGYHPQPVAAMALVLCLYSVISGFWPLALVIVLGQLFWVLKWGSSNWFDHVLHVLLWPIALISLLARLL